jgi:RNA polymerase sigma-70 factor, ECF subfamily
MGQPGVSDPSDGSQADVTAMLHRWAGGDSVAGDRLACFLYPELKRVARIRMRSERVDHTLQPTALINEFFLVLARQKKFEWKNRTHFLAVASRAMRRLLIDYARLHKSEKRGGLKPKLQIEDLRLHNPCGTLEMLEFNDLLEKLELEEPRMAKVLELRCFGGLTNAEIGEILGIDERTVSRDWSVARAWLKLQLEKGELDVSRGVGAD